MREISTIEEWEACLGASREKPLFVLKHSTRCAISARAYDEVVRYAAKADAVDVVLVKVIESRPVSDAIADALGIEHKSPQLFLLKDGCAAWSASHYGINLENIEDAAKGVS